MSTPKRERRQSGTLDAPETSLMLKHPLFDCLSPEQHVQLMGYLEAVPFRRHQVLIPEGSLQTRFYVVLSGKLGITRHDPDTGEEVVLTCVGRGALVGESGALLARPAIAGVVADSDGLAASLDVERLRSGPDTAALWTALLEGTARELATKLEEAGTRTVSYYRWQLAQLQEKRSAGRFTLRLLVCLGVFALLASALTSLEQQLPTRLFVTATLVLICALATWLFMKDSHLKPADFGVTLHNWRAHAIESIRLSAPILIGVLALKGMVLNGFGPQALSLFQPGLAIHHSSTPLVMTVLIASAILGVAQEFVVRCGIQGSLQIFYSEDRFEFPWRAVLVSNLLFAATYAHLSPLWAALVFVPGLFWGWLFARQNSLVGIAISHALISTCTLLVFGFPAQL